MVTLTKQQAEVLAPGPAHTQADKPIQVGKGCATVVIVAVLAAQVRWSNVGCTGRSLRPVHLVRVGRRSAGPPHSAVPRTPG
jgi:hypothetical protein